MFIDVGLENVAVAAARVVIKGSSKTSMSIILKAKLIIFINAQARKQKLQAPTFITHQNPIEQALFGEYTNIPYLDKFLYNKYI